MTSDSINRLILEYLVEIENEMKSVYLAGENSTTIGSRFI